MSHRVAYHGRFVYLPYEKRDILKEKFIGKQNKLVINLHLQVVRYHGVM